MKNCIIVFWFFNLWLLLIVDVAAQPQPLTKIITPQQVAEQHTDMMAEHLSLTKKQRKKVYKINLKQAEKAQSVEKTSFSPPQGGRGGRQGGPPMGGGMNRGQGDMRRPDGGQRPQMQSKQQPPTISEDKMPGMPYMETEEEIAKRQAKMKKILTAEQYPKWLQLEQDRRQQEFNRLPFEN